MKTKKETYLMKLAVLLFGGITNGNLGCISLHLLSRQFLDKIHGYFLLKL